MKKPGRAAPRTRWPVCRSTDFVRRRGPPLRSSVACRATVSQRGVGGDERDSDDDLLKLILDNAGLLACRHARVSKQWKRAAEAVKLSRQTLEQHLSCGGWDFDSDEEDGVLDDDVRGCVRITHPSDC